MPSVTKSKAGYPCLVCFAGDAVLAELRQGGLAGLDELGRRLEGQARRGMLLPCAARQWNGKAVGLSASERGPSVVHAALVEGLKAAAQEKPVSGGASATIRVSL
jgi:hypothetical protein